MQKNQMSILLARLSLLTAILSACALILSWVGKSLLGTHEAVIGVFIIAFCLSAAAVVMGILAIVRSCEAGEQKIAWLGTIVGLILFVPTGAVAVIFLIILFSD